jgi:hypothetical protein
MRRVTVLAGLGAVLLAAGCRPREINSEERLPQAAAPIKATPDDLVKYVNDNARLVQSIKCPRVDIDAKQDGENVALDGTLVCKKDRYFRLKASLGGTKPVADVGSNQDEFWYWVAEQRRRDDATPNYVYHCTHADMADGKAKTPFPFQPDMIVSALGMGELDPAKKYTIKDDDPKTIGLVEETTSAQGQPVQKVIVFSRAQARPGKPQVLAYLLVDPRNGEEICRANVLEVQSVPVDRDNRTAVLPSKVDLIWKAQKLKMTLQMYDIQVNNVGDAQVAKMFNRRDLADRPSFDLAHGPDGAAGYTQGNTAPGGNPIRQIGGTK